jgi:hypothetical protein
MNKSKRIDEKFIYSFNLKEKINKKNVKEICIDMFKQFLKFYKVLNQKKKRDFPNLMLDNFVLEENKTKTNFYAFVVTRPYQNHPFTLYGSYNDYNIKIIIPIGKDLGQYNIKKINKELKILSKEEKYALMKLLLFTIRLRKHNFETVKNSKDLYDCLNIKECKNKINKLKYTSLFNRNQKINNINNESYDTIKVHIKKYFELLDNNEFEKANNYLNTIKNLYYKSKDIIGHLQILIEIYKTINRLKELN